MKCKYCQNDRFITSQSSHRYVITDENGKFLHPYPYYGEDSLPKSPRFTGSFECTVCGAKYTTLGDDAVCENGPVDDWGACADFNIEFIHEKEASRMVKTSNGSTKETTHIWRNKYYIVHTTELGDATYASIDLRPDPDVDAEYLPQIVPTTHITSDGRETVGEPRIQTTSHGALSVKEYVRLQRAMNIALCSAEEIERKIFLPLRRRVKNGGVL